MPSLEVRKGGREEKLPAGLKEGAAPRVGGEVGRVVQAEKSE